MMFIVQMEIGMKKSFGLIFLSATIMASSSIQKILPSVVNIYLDEKDHIHHTLGSGVIVDSKNGYIITNAHVVKSSGKIIVTLENKNYFEARVVGVDKDSDIAVLKINAPNITAASISYRPVSIGQKIYTVGNPYGLSNTVTSGIISAKGRKIGLEKYENFIQLDAAINPGNSGGALVDENGNLIGINTAVFSTTGTNIGLGFAIPAYMFSPIASQLIRYGKMDRSTLGVYVQNMNPKLAKALGHKTMGGVLVSRIVPKSNAEALGIKALDIITQIGPNLVNSFLDLNSIIGTLRVNQDISVTILRQSKTIRLSGKFKKFKYSDSKSALSGVVLAPVEYWNEKENVVKGLRVADIKMDSRAWLAGLRPNDILVSANGILVKQMEDIAKFEQQASLLLIAKRDGIEQFLVID